MTQTLLTMILVANSQEWSQPNMGYLLPESVLMISALRSPRWRNMPRSLHPQEIPPVPEATRRVARAAFPRDNIYMYMRMRDADA
jgi:hypothetical protein